MKQISKFTYIFLIMSIVSTIYIATNVYVYAQNVTSPMPIEPPPVVVVDPITTNTNVLIAAIVAITGLVGTIATIIPQIISLKRNVLGIENKRDNDIVRISQSIGETDDWVLENLDKLRIGLGSTLTLSSALNKIVTDNKDKLQLSEAELLKIKQELEKISSIIPPAKEIEEIKTELSKNARDPLKIG